MQPMKQAQRKISDFLARFIFVMQYTRLQYTRKLVTSNSLTYEFFLGFVLFYAKTIKTICYQALAFLEKVVFCSCFYCHYLHHYDKIKLDCYKYSWNYYYAVIRRRKLNNF